jgi:hypothetical protein
MTLEHIAPPNEDRSMIPKPVPFLAQNTFAYETCPMVKPTGFREYDARWLFEKEINLMGVQALGLGLGTSSAWRRGSSSATISGPIRPRSNMRS